MHLPALLCVGLPLIGCGGGGGSGGGGGPPPIEVLDVTRSLNRLGVNTTSTPRRAQPDVEVPDGYCPLGPAPALSKTDELLLFGIGLGQTSTNQPLVVLELTDEQGAAVAEPLHVVGTSTIPWAAEQRPQSSSFQSLRAPVAADIDGDGLQETVAVYQAGVETRVFVVGNQPTGFAERDFQIAFLEGVTCVTAAAGDLDGDGDDELVVGVVRNGVGEVRVFRYEAGTFVAVGPVHSFGPTLANTQMHFQFAIGNLDYDPACEIAIAINEANQDLGAARIAVLDDLDSGLAILRQGDFSGLDQSNVLRIGITASVAIGDIDGDNLGEVLVGGFTAFSNFCAGIPHFLLAIDDKVSGLQDIAGRYFDHFYDGCTDFNPPRTRTVFLNTLDLDGDGIAEIQANQFVFQDFAAAAPWTEVAAWRLPQEAIWSSGSVGWIDRSTASMVVGDFTGDDRDDIAVYRQDTGFVDVYALGATATSIQRMRRVTVPFTNGQFPRNRYLVPVNVDTDSTVLKHSPGDYQLVFTEPVVLAVLAAPPTAQGIGQNVEASCTAFGNTSTTITENERSLSLSVGRSVGFKVDGGALTQSEFELKGTLTVRTEFTVGTAYELSKTIIFTSAPTEDTVVFTSVPIDRYTYTVLTSPDPTLVGRQVTIDLPRSPITLQAERGFYNASLPPGTMRIDDEVFQHVIGAPRSYPTAAQKNARLQGGGLQVGPQSVGQGGGSTEVTLEVGNAVSSGGALELGFDLELELTAGAVLTGLNLGVAGTSTWRVTSGSSTSYTGIVGAIDAANFAANRYEFGLFTYVQRDQTTGRQFQVLNYWVQ